MWDPQRLRSLRELQLRGTITAVAEALNFSPSTVSHQLAQLEREVGVQLIAPSGRRVMLPSAGETLAAHAARLLELEESTRAQLMTAEPAVETVRIALMESSAWGLLPWALDSLAASRSPVRVEGAVVPPEEGLDELERRVFDLAIAEQYSGHTRRHRPGLVRIALGADPIRVATHAADTATAIADLRDRAWVMEPSGTAARTWAVQQCRAAGFEPDVRFESADLQTHIGLIRAGHAVGVLPGLAWAGHARSMRPIDLVGTPTREVFLAHRDASASRIGLQHVVAALQAGFVGLADRLSE